MDSAAVQDDKPIETTTTTIPTSTTLPPACGNYRIDTEISNVAGTSVYRFSVSELTSEQAAPLSPNPLQWTSSSPGVSNNQNASYSISDPSRNCSAVTVQARITNACGSEQTLTKVFTIQGCPEPQTGNVACAQRHKIPGSSSSNLGWIQLAGGAPWTYKDISTLRKAYGIPLSQAFISSDAGILVGKNQIYQMALSTLTPPANSPPVQRKLEFKIESSGIVSPPGITAGACPMMISISDCSEDFYISRESNGCLSQYDGSAGVLAVFDAQASDNLPANVCRLQSNKNYFINVTAHNPTQNWAYAKQDDPLTPNDESLESCLAISSLEIRNLAP